MQKMSYFSSLLFTCLDVCVVRAIRQAQLSALLPHPFIMLWGGALIRACLLLLFATYQRSLPWMRSFQGLQSIGVLCFHCPFYISCLWALGQSTLDQLWGWHSWQGLIQCYGVTIVAWLYWSHYTPSLLTRRTNEKAKEDTGPSIWRLMGYLWPYRRRLVAVLILIVLSCRCQMAVPEYTGRLGDWIMNEDTPDAFSHAIKVMTLITIASAVFEFVGDLMYNITMNRVHTSVQGLVFQSVLKQEMAFFDSTETAKMVSHITNDTNKMSEALSEQLSEIIWYFARLIFILYFMVSQSWKLSLFTFMGLPLILFIPKLTGHFHQRIAVQVQESLAKANQVATETFSCIKTVRSFANEDGETERYLQRIEDTYTINKQEACSYAANHWTASMSSLSLKVCILYYGGMLVTRGTVGSGNLVTFILYELEFSSALEALMRCYPEVKKAIGCSKKIFEYLDRKPQVPPEGTLAPEQLNGLVQFRNVTFAYPGRRDTPVLKNVSLEMKPGQVTALVGLNSSGKSTCVKLLERFYTLEAGEILLDGQPLHCYKDQYLHDKISVVSQQSVLFARSIRENIKYGCESVSDDEMYAAARLASAHEFITKLPNGYETDAGEKGGQVSGGQKQRVAIARALIRRPTILILDNSTSQLDAEAEHQVHQALLKDSYQRSVLLISHKMSVVEKAHHIVVLNNGEVEEEGSHKELLSKDGFYAALVRKQNVGDTVLC